MNALRDLRFAWPLVGAAGSWGVATAVSKRALDEFDPLVLLPIQLAVSVMFLLLVTGVRREPVVWNRQTRRLAVLGLLNPGASYALSLAGLALVTASLSVLLWAVEPLLILLVARVVLGDRITPPLAGSLLAATAGVVLVVHQGGTRGPGTGVLLTLAGVLACAVYTVLCRSALLDDATVPVVLVQQAAALCLAVVLAVGGVMTGLVSDLGPVSPGGWASAVGSGVLYYAIAFWFYLSGLRRVPAAVAGAFINLVPVFGVGAGYLLLGDRLTARQWAGAVVVLVAVATLALSRQTGARDERRPHAAV